MFSIGKIKWFGGKNSKTGMDNQYGFVEDVDGEDAFLHASTWTSETFPSEGNVVLYSLRDESRGLKAVDVAPAEEASLSLPFASDLLERLVKYRKGAPGENEFERHMRRMAKAALLEADVNEIRRLLHSATRRRQLWELLATGAEWKSDLEELVARDVFNPFEVVPWHLLPDIFFIRDESTLVEYLRSLDAEEVARRVQESHEKLPVSLLVYLASIGKIDSSIELGSQRQLVDDFVENIVFHNDLADPNYLAAHVQSRFGGYRGLGESEMLAPAMDLARFKRLLFEKDPAFVELYNTSPNLKTRIDCFILSNIFELVVAGNSLDTVYEVFLRRLWEGIMAEQYDLRESGTRELLLNLMPSCRALGLNLSCEAFFWKTDDQRNSGDIYLCRGKRCDSPEVIADPTRTWRRFTLYDWFAHYGITYSIDDKPARRDFPIKLAGYFNRVLELLERLDCRDCGTLMLPDTRYARTGWWAETPTGRVWKNQEAAYRTTVFHCANDICQSFNVKYYINHCCGFKCHEFIDSRDLREKCELGRYICLSCDSCCSQHAQKPLSVPSSHINSITRSPRSFQTNRHRARSTAGHPRQVTKGSPPTF